MSVLVGLGLLLLITFDLAVTTPGWPYVVYTGVLTLAIAAAVLSGARADIVAMSAVTLSWAGTGAFAASEYQYAGSWGFAESAALLLVAIERIRHARRRADWVLVAAVVIAVLAQSLRLGARQAPLLAELLCVAVAAAASIGVVLRAADGQHRLAVIEVRRAERMEIARELHDVVAHHVTGMIVATQAARVVEASTPEALPPAVSSALASVEAAGTEALTSMRRLVEVLRASSDTAADRHPVPGIADLDELVARFRSSDAVARVRLAIDARCAELPVEVQAGIYRVVRESLTNIQRHAPGARRVDVQVVRSGAGVDLRVKNGPGTGTPAGDLRLIGGGFGLSGMRERVIALGGALAAGPDGGGWAVQASVPIAPAASKMRSTT